MVSGRNCAFAHEFWVRSPVGGNQLPPFGEAKESEEAAFNRDHMLGVPRQGAPLWLVENIDEARHILRLKQLRRMYVVGGVAQRPFRGF
jgi:hypothetical protein